METSNELADTIINRLNKLISNPEVSKDVLKLIETRIPVSQSTAENVSVQVSGPIDVPVMGFLGLLNGIVGVVPDGPRKGWGFIAAVVSDKGELMWFERTDKQRVEYVQE